MINFPDPGAWFGGEVAAVHPPDPATQRDTLNSATFEDGDSPEITLALLQSILRPPDAHPRQLPGSTGWGLFKKQYARIGLALHDVLSTGPLGPSWLRPSASSGQR